MLVKSGRLCDREKGHAKFGRGELLTAILQINNPSSAFGVGSLVMYCGAAVVINADSPLCLRLGRKPYSSGL